ncbi:hypothetical protein XIS1_1550008 [Xenorhabdus innexi]|uniref:Uncharacterized protein n=1 Tax=Xenorhabdus innexi TaxID=290109 RepID=A0A1N6MUV9_9GAMM|nr:hypothetical protein Xinn_03662 [Xenorhabdus innexi]SIP72529.1 hypothetical protein XIS1_1550008 [Xenorhabdus innexi]
MGYKVVFYFAIDLFSFYIMLLVIVVTIPMREKSINKSGNKFHKCVLYGIYNCCFMRVV